IISEVYEGDVRLVVPFAISLKQVIQFQEHLRQLDKIRIALVGGSVNEGVIIVVSLQSPVNLIPILNEIPVVEKVEKKGKDVVITLKTSDAKTVPSSDTDIKAEADTEVETETEVEAEAKAKAEAKAEAEAETETETETETEAETEAEAETEVELKT
ncbi:hypothetical protein ACFLYE_04010, partial [Chloroflexota bacterium]